MRETRLFTLHWDNSKNPHLSYDQRFGTHHCTGTHYATGVVTLDNGAVYESMFELETTLKQHGRCRVVYHDDGGDDGSEEQPGRVADERVVMMPRLRSQKKR